jgi:lipopolysaccharide/colanic/teichoic acid biosynthesis glycosyltransferase
MTPAKRLFDILFALLLVALFLPVLAILFILMLILQGRPILYVSERMKTPDQGFRFYKLRTMSMQNDSDNLGVSGGDKDNRVTGLGRILRKARLDELPQLWNVLCGDMSFVGPRPPLRQYVDRFPDLYQRVLQNRPGITGLATLTFHKHEENLLRDCKTAEETHAIYCRRCIPRKASIDLIYQAKRTLCMDVWLMAKTAVKILPF